MTPSDPSTPARPLEDELEMAYAWIADLKQHLKNVLESATPNEKDHPTMFEAWKHGRHALSQAPFEAGYPQARADLIQYVSLLNGRLSTVVEALRNMTDCPSAPTFCNCPAHEKRHAILRDFPEEPKP